MPGEIRDRRTGARLKGVYKMVVRAAMMYSLETLTFSLGVTMMDKIRNECIQETPQVERFEDKVGQG